MKFSKYNSCGNDFIIIDNSNEVFSTYKKGDVQYFEYM